MKKIIIAAAIVGMAVVSQASCAAWKYQYTTQNSAVVDSTVYLVLGSYTGSKTFDDLAAIKSASENSTGYKTKTNTTPVWSNTVGDTLDSASLTSATPYLYMVLVNKDETGYFVSDVYDATANLYEPGGSKKGTLSIKPSSISFTSFGGSGDVPEPTSTMLLLLGVAGLALRRKQA